MLLPGKSAANKDLSWWSPGHRDCCQCRVPCLTLWPSPLRTHTHTLHEQLKPYWVIALQAGTLGLAAWAVAAVKAWCGRPEDAGPSYMGRITAYILLLQYTLALVGFVMWAMGPFRRNCPEPRTAFFCFMAYVCNSGLVTPLVLALEIQRAKSIQSFGDSLNARLNDDSDDVELLLITSNLKLAKSNPELFADCEPESHPAAVARRFLDERSGPPKVPLLASDAAPTMPGPPMPQSMIATSFWIRWYLRLGMVVVFPCVLIPAVAYIWFSLPLLIVLLLGVLLAVGLVGFLILYM